MIDFKKKKRIKRIFNSWLLVIALLVLVVLLGRGVWNVYQKERTARQLRDRVADEHSEMEEREAFLERDIARLETQEGVEEEIRERFGFGKEGERVIVVVEPDEEDLAASREEAGFWARVRDFFSF